ncbi:M3 family metallopeptidase [Pinibacter aurantiacus]|nr:M3 family metallopeptidase [Pinibacter aurantiacus]
MRRVTVITAMALWAMSNTGCSNAPASTSEQSLKDNPFMAESQLPYGIPALDKIKDADYRPALLKGIEIHSDEIKKITESTEAPTFDNTLVAMESSGILMRRVLNTFNMVTGANTNEFLSKLKEEVDPMMAVHNDEIFLNQKLFKKVETIYNDREHLQLDAESKRLVEYYYQKFLMAGAMLSDVDKATLKQLNEKEASLTAKYNNLLLGASKQGALLISDSTQLAGVAENDKAAFAHNASAAGSNGKWLIPLQNTTQQPMLQSLSNRSTREALFNASWTRAEKGDSNDTRNIIAQIVALRVKKAKLLGFEDFAAWKLQDQMAQKPTAVMDFLSKLQPYAMKKANAEAADIQALIDKQNGGFKLEPYDWDYYAEKVRKAKYDLDESEIKPYFEMNKVLEDGVFYAANLLYGITFKPRHDIPVYQEDVKVYEVFDKDGQPMAMYFCDPYKRDNKEGGAWMSNLVDQSHLLNKKPVIYNVCNFTKPANGQPALISFDDVTTIFHEFGHSLHGLFANQKYPSLSGANTARDFVEFPSQFNEHWALDPAVLSHYAVHYKTGKPIPASLVEKIRKAATFNKGYSLSELVSASILDMQWHMLKDTSLVKDVDAFEKNALLAVGMQMTPVPPRYRSSYFKHIWTGYEAGYYAYQWTKMLEEDAYAWFRENGGINRANGQRFRDMILSKGNTEDYMTMFKNFRGRTPDITPMLQDLGMIEH